MKEESIDAAVTQEELGDNTEATVEQPKAQMHVFPWSWEQPESFEYGDVHIWCRQCGTDNKVSHPSMSNMQTMMAINPVPVNNDGVIAMGCENCGAQVVMHFRKASNPPAEEETITDTETLNQDANVEPAEAADENKEN